MMAEKSWEVTKIFFCDRVGKVVNIENEVVYPADFLPDAPRIIAHRCSLATECNLDDKPVCAWCGTNPNFEPS
jgi:hypothetical protein